MELGKWRNYTQFFVENRNDYVNQIASQTNNLIIRLDKLINRQLLSDDVNKKDFEKSIVLWSDDSEFSSCRVCNAKFSLTRRRHHCRLCGKIMCNNCSQFLSFGSARKLTGPEFGSENGFKDFNGFDSESKEPSSSSPSSNMVLERRSLSLIPSDSLQFVRSRTEKIFGSLINSKDNLFSQDASGEELKDRLRVCDVCKILLNRRGEAMDLRTAHSVFVDVYEKLFALLSQIAKLAPSYKHMADSLNNGESTYKLEAAAELRRKIVSIQREITSLSERIESWGISEEADDPLITKKPGSREILLQRNIKILAINSLHDALSTLPDLPSEEHYRDLRHRFKARLSAEHEATTASITASLTADGCIAGTSDHPDEEVIQQQYVNIKMYLEQAAKSGQLEEVELLERNLFDMESFYGPILMHLK